MSAISANTFTPTCAQILLIICCWYETDVFKIGFNHRMQKKK